ncbi:MAG: ImmA/IrrE family metallo-endopeptidase [Bacteroidetes bacterium]|nr:ImmA/IrrE family metallo-endopeptidase [Bacteroidota bacterium]
MLKLTDINTNIFEWAINYCGEGDAISIKFPNLSKWIKRDDFPTVRQLEKFSKATRVPFGYFFLDEPPTVSLSIPFFRTLSVSLRDEDENHPVSFSPELIDTVRIIEQRQAWLKEYLIQNGFEPLPFVGSKNTNVNYKTAAENIKTELGLNDKWASKLPNWENALSFLIEKTEEAGINVIRNGVVGNNTHRKLNYKEFRGLVMVDEHAPFVFINGSDFKSAQMFTLAHELAHIWLGSSAIFDLRQMLPADNETEKLCDKIAAEFLVPETYLKEEWNIVKQKEDPLQAIARSFKVSELVAARRVLDLGLISKTNFFEFYNEYLNKIPKGKEKNKGGDFYNNQPYKVGKRFANTIFTAVKEGSLLYRDAYKLTGLTSKTFQEFENKLRSV